jgi:hypothetical protein
LVTKVDQTFVMRFWQENGSVDPANPNRWRATINRAGSDQQFHAVGLEKAFGLVRTLLLTQNDSAQGEKPGQNHS